MRKFEDVGVFCAMHLPVDKSGIPHSFEVGLRALLSWLRDAKAKGVIIGGLAASVLGRPRTTKDIDALVMMDDAQWKAFLDAGAKHGFVATRADPLGFAQRNRLFRMLHTPSRLEVDISMGATPFEDECLNRSSILVKGDLAVPLISPEDLIIMKAIAHRTVDFVDIEVLLETRDGLDMGRIRKWVKDFSRALESPEIVEDLEKIIRKVQGPPTKRRKK